MDDKMQELYDNIMAHDGYGTINVCGLMISGNLTLLRRLLEFLDAR